MAVEVRPGQHRIELLRNTANLIGRRGEHFWVTLTVEAGHTYLAQTDEIDDRTYFWVEDIETGETVGGSRPNR